MIVTKSTLNQIEKFLAPHKWGIFHFLVDFLNQCDIIIIARTSFFHYLFLFLFLGLPRFGGEAFFFVDRAKLK